MAHVALVCAVWAFHDRDTTRDPELVDIEVAPPPPEVEALPAEVAKLPEEDLTGTRGEVDPASAVPPPPPPSEGYTVDAGVDALVDAAPDAPIDAPIDAPRDARPDAPTMDAAEPIVATTEDAAVPDAQVIAELDATSPDAQVVAELADAQVLGDTGDAQVVAELGDAGTTGDATTVASAGSGGEGSAAEGSGAGAGSGKEPGSIAMEAGSGAGVPGQFNEPAVDGAPTTAGTAANLLTYFPRGHMVTAMIRFDRLRGTEWEAQTERLLQPMPDYQVLFGGQRANVASKLDTLVISTPSPRDATATTLVGRTHLPRTQLRELLQAGSPVTWSTVKGGLLGKRSRTFRGDQRVFLSPYQNWFLLAQPTDLGGLTAAAPGNLDNAVVQGKPPAWIGGIRTIEKESGDEQRGPALVLTIMPDGKRVDLGDNDFGLGIKSIPTPDRISLAMELVKQGWLVRGNMRFGSEKDAIELIGAAEKVKQLVADSRLIQSALGKPLARVVTNLSFARTGGRVSYTTSISIADARAILGATAQQLDGYFGGQP
ncbi:MAG: hypothetical protein SFX73_21045 [Kofleriaceae bacterium]|nr:hypothetical protein [Kofleriaceae bacterium]